MAVPVALLKKPARLVMAVAVAAPLLIWRLPAQAGPPGDWHASNAAPMTSPRGISCPDDQTCYMVGFSSQNPGASILGTKDGGQTWNVLRPGEGGNILNDISCPAPETCFAVGSTSAGKGVLATRDGGDTWQFTRFSILTNVAAVSCGVSQAPAAQTCVAAGHESRTAGAESPAFAVTTDGGQNWTQRFPSVPEGGALTDVDCPTSVACFAVGRDGAAPLQPGVSPAPLILVSKTRGVAWTKMQAPGAYLSSISCPDESRCYAVSALSGAGGTGVI
ncbi:MAG: WD40/YVTN/BNR-like repeat-containing protein, partial [Actinomycetota bacterium]